MMSKTISQRKKVYQKPMVLNADAFSQLTLLSCLIIYFGFSSVLLDFNQSCAFPKDKEIKRVVKICNQ